jgi:hypothetical protein
MKKPVAILFLLLAATMYGGLIISYIGCRFLPSSAATSFCSCEQVIISSMYHPDSDHPLHDGIISKVQADFSISLFNQHSMHFLEELIILSSAKPCQSRHEFRAVKGFIGSILRPPAMLANISFAS